MSDSGRVHRPLYRVYHLNRDGGIVRADIIEARDDADAIDTLEALADDHAVELWDRARFIAKVEPPLAALVPRPIIVRNDHEPISLPAADDLPREPRVKLH